MVLLHCGTSANMVMCILRIQTVQTILKDT
jgi:hypothetical protein